MSNKTLTVDHGGETFVAMTYRRDETEYIVLQVYHDGDIGVEMVLPLPAMRQLCAWFQAQDTAQEQQV